MHRGPGAVNSRLGSVAKSLTSDRSDDPLTINGVLSRTPTLGLALGCAVLLPALDGLGWRVVSLMFDRERLITGTR